jgi:hypothetical protein
VRTDQWFRRKHRRGLSFKPQEEQALRKVSSSMTVHAYNPSTQLSQEDHEFKARLGYIVRLCLKNNPKPVKEGHHEIPPKAVERDHVRDRQIRDLKHGGHG